GARQRQIVHDRAAQSEKTRAMSSSFSRLPSHSLIPGTQTPPGEKTITGGMKGIKDDLRSPFSSFCGTVPAKNHRRRYAMAIKPGWEGRFYEDFEVGDIYRCRLGRTVTENDNIWFTLLTNNTNQIHFNNEYGKRTEFGKCLINSALTLAIVAGMGVADVSENGFALGWDEIKLPNPLFAGDTLYSESEVLETRESKSKPQWGIIKVRTRGIQQEGKVVIDYARSVMVWKRAHAPKQQLFPEIRS